MMLTFFRLILLFAGSLFCALSTCLAEQPRESFGLWVEAEGRVRPFNSKEEFENLFRFLDKAQFTDLYCQVYRRGRSWFPSQVADQTPYLKAQEQGFDPLAGLLSYAHARGVRVHAWINTLRVANNPKAPLFQKYGRGVALVDSQGHSLLDYSSEGKAPSGPGKLGTPGAWLDPSSTELRVYLSTLIAELLEKYPSLDGVHLDMVRYPISMVGKKVSYGRTPAALKKFQSAQVEGKKLSWDDWRRLQVTEVVETLRKVVKTDNQTREFSAAVIAWPNRAHSHAMQDWLSWLRNGVIDSVVLMAYTVKDAQITNLTSVAVSARRPGTRVNVGLGAWLMLDRSYKLENQVRRAFEQGADGVTLFSYANLASARGEQLVSQLFRKSLRR